MVGLPCLRTSLFDVKIVSWFLSVELGSRECKLVHAKIVVDMVRTIA